jgi:hypothetical protein
VAGYWLVDRKLHLKDRADRAADEAEKQNAVRNAVLRVAHGELEFVAARIETYKRALEEDKVPYPVFDTNGWTLLSQAHVLVAVRPDSSEALVNAYNRIRSANGQLEMFSNMTVGPMAVGIHTDVAVARRGDGTLPPAVDDIAHRYEGHRLDVRSGLIDRLADLREHMDKAIDAVEAELGLARNAPSSMRSYNAGPVREIGG